MEQLTSGLIGGAAHPGHGWPVLWAAVLAGRCACPRPSTPSARCSPRSCWSWWWWWWWCSPPRSPTRVDRRRCDDRAVPGDARDQPLPHQVTIEVAADDDELHTLPSRVHALVLVSRPGDPDAADDARGPLSWPDPTADLLRQGPARRAPADRDHGVHPEYVVTHWWQQLLHNQSALRFKARLLFTPGVVVVSVPTTSESPRTAGWSGRGRQESVNVLAPGVRISSRCAPRRLSASSV
jgi:hypothetical protein